MVCHVNGPIQCSKIGQLCRLKLSKKMKNRDNVPAAGGFFLKIWIKLAYFSYILTLFLSKSAGAKTYFCPLTLKSKGTYVIENKALA